MWPVFTDVNILVVCMIRIARTRSATIGNQSTSLHHRLDTVLLSICLFWTGRVSDECGLLSAFAASIQDIIAKFNSKQQLTSNFLRLARPRIQINATTILTRYSLVYTISSSTFEDIKQEKKALTSSLRFKKLNYIASIQSMSQPWFLFGVIIFIIFCLCC